MLLLISGLPGRQKHTGVARTARYGGTPISSDLIRSELGLKGITPEGKKRVYAAMLECGGFIYRRSAVVDSTFTANDPCALRKSPGHAGCFALRHDAQEATIRQRVANARPDSGGRFRLCGSAKKQRVTLMNPGRTTLELVDSESVDTFA
ncbi:MAG: hypothetical protein IPM98_22630 [Lewinellaceae bacterium]|nr:hypothetical protein [Lewinellaceae bacterium]